jgi:hypothetical protein
MQTVPALSIIPVLKEIDETCPSPTDLVLMIKRSVSGFCSSDGAITIEGLKSAVASKAYSEVK